MIDSALLAILKADSSINALVGDEIYIGLNPNPSDLYITVQLLRQTRVNHIDAAGDVHFAKFQVDCFGKRSPSVSTLAETIEQAIHFTSDTGHGHNITMIRVDDESSRYESGEKLFNRSLDVSVIYS